MDENERNGFTETPNDNTQNSQENYSNNTYQNRPPQQPYYHHAESIPNSVAALVLGICSVVFVTMCVGLVCGIIGLVLGNRGLRFYRENPSRYRGFGTLNAGRILSIIGIVFGGLMVIFWIIFSGFFVGACTNCLLGHCIGLGHWCW